VSLWRPRDVALAVLGLTLCVSTGLAEQPGTAAPRAAETRHIAFQPIGDLLPLSHTPRLVSHFASCLGFIIQDNDSPSAKGTAVPALHLRTGFFIVAGFSAPASIIVEATKSGVIVATLGNESSIFGTRYVLYALKTSELRTRPKSHRVGLAIAGNSILDMDGAVDFARRNGVEAKETIRMKSPDQALDALRQGRADFAALRLTGLRPNSDGFDDIDVRARGPVIPIVGVVRSTAMSRDEAKRVEDCLFSFRFHPEDSQYIPGVDRFVALNGAKEMVGVREVVEALGYDLDRWNYRAVVLPWR